jgi:hypothetical protein
MLLKTLVHGVVLAASSGMCCSVLAQSGEQVINGTRVFTQIDQGRGVATFSNSCGSQTLTQRQLQNGAIPDQIIPCPRPAARPQMPRTTPAEDGKRFLRQLAEQHANKGMEAALNGNYGGAREEYDRAERLYRQNGDHDRADVLKEPKRRYHCTHLLKENSNSPDVLRHLSGEKKDELRHIFDPFGLCKEFPDAMQTIRQRLAELTSGGPRLPVPIEKVQPKAATPSDSSGSSRWLPPGSLDQPKTANTPPPAPPKDIHMGNKGIETGPKAKERPTHGLSLYTRQTLDAVRNDPVRRNAYMKKLSPQERRNAQAYLNDPLTGGGITKDTTYVPQTSSAECTEILRKIRQHAPDRDWIKWHMDRSFCREDGKAMSQAEYHAELARRIDRMPDYK